MEKILLTLPFVAVLLCSNGVFASSSSDSGNKDELRFKAPAYSKEEEEWNKEYYAAREIWDKGGEREKYEADMKKDREREKELESDLVADIGKDYSKLHGLVTGNKKLDEVSQAIVVCLDILISKIKQNKGYFDKKKMETDVDWKKKMPDWEVKRMSEQEDKEQACIEIYKRFKESIVDGSTWNENYNKAMKSVVEMVSRGGGISEGYATPNSMFYLILAILQASLDRQKYTPQYDARPAWRYIYEGPVLGHIANFLKDLFSNLPGDVFRRIEADLAKDGSWSERFRDIANEIANCLDDETTLELLRKRIGEVGSKLIFALEGTQYGLPDQYAE